MVQNISKLSTRVDLMEFPETCSIRMLVGGNEFKGHFECELSPQ